jgi:hypothetical protein
MSASVRTGAKPGLVSRFAHLMGGRKPRAEDKPADQDDVDDVKDDVDDVKDDVDDVEDRVDDLEDRADDAEEDDEDDSPSDMDAKAHKRGVKAGRKAERARCAAIFGAKEAAGNISLAASLAFETDLPAKQAVALLRAGTAAPAQASAGGLRSRMNAVKPINLGTTNPNPKAGADTAFDLVMSSYALATGQKKEG